MNYIWSAMLLTAIVCGFFNGTLAETVNAAFDGAAAAAETVLSLTGIICLWTGILTIAERSGISAAFERLLSPLISRLFKSAPAVAREHITMNIAANILGMGNAATPAGIRAMSELDKANPHPKTPTRSMAMLMVLNTASVQLIPATIIALRRSAGSAAPESVALPIVISSLIGCIAAVAAVRLFMRGRYA